MVTEGPGRGVRCRRLALLIFLLVYVPLDACDADTADTFEGGAVQIRVKADEDAVQTVPDLVETSPEIVPAAGQLQAVAPLPGPISTFAVTRTHFCLPRSDDPHVASSPPIECPVPPFLV